MCGFSLGSEELSLRGKSDENEVRIYGCVSVRLIYGSSSITFEHTGEEWKRTMDEYHRWGWYRGVVVPVAAGEVTVVANASMFESTKEWDIYIGLNSGFYGSDGAEYSATRYASKRFDLHTLKRSHSVVYGEIWFPDGLGDEESRVECWST